MSYYKTINGIKMDAKLIDHATRLVSEAGDGRLSGKDAELLLKLATDGNAITQVEHDTLDYILENFRWTAKAEDWFRKKILNWAKTPIRISLTDLSTKHFAGVDVLKDDPEAQLSRTHALQAATNETSQDHDEIGLWIQLKDGTTVEVLSNFIELEDDFVQLKGGCMVPVRAIEKVEI